MKKITLLSDLWRRGSAGETLVPRQSKDDGTARLRVDYVSITSRLRVWHVLCSRMAAVFLLMLTLSIGNAWGEITNNNNGTYTEPSGTGTFSSNTITWSFAGGNITVVQTATGGNNPNSSYTTAGRVYRYNTLTVSASNGFKVEKVEITCDGSNYGNSIAAGTSVTDNVVGNTSNVTSDVTYSNNHTHAFTPATAGAKTLFYIRNVNSGSTNTQLRWTSGKLKVTYSYTAPTAVTEGTVTSSSFGLSITDALNTNKYDVYFSTSFAAPTATTSATVANQTTKTPTISSGVSAGQSYYVWVRSVKTISTDTWKSLWTAMTGNPLSTPSAGGSSYTLTFLEHSDGTAASGSPSTGSVTENATSFSFGATEPSKTGYKIEGFYTDQSANSGVKVANASREFVSGVAGWTDGSSRYTKGSNANLYIKWQAKQAAITFDKNGGTGGSDGTTATYDAAMTTITPPTRAGYTFDGYWDTETDNNGSGNKYYNANGTSAATWNKNTEAATTLYAKWVALTDTYKTALHTGASGWTAYASGVTKNGAGYTILNPGSVAKGATSTCEDTHYHFAGWVTDANKEAGTISGNIIAATGTTDATGTTYWAVWEKEAAGGANSIELNYSNLSVSTSSYAKSDATIGGVGFTINQGYRGGSNPNYLIQMNSSKGDGTLFNTTAISGLDSIKLYCATAGATATIYQGSSEKPTSTSDPDERVGTAACAASTNYKIAFTGSGEYFTLKVGGATYFSKIEIYYSTYEDPKVECEACAATPSVTGVSLSGSTFSLTSVPVQATGASAGTNCSLSSYGFYWGTSASPTGNSTESNNLSTGTFSATLTGTFSVGQTYHYRAFATNNGGYTGYSSDGTFTLRSVTFNLNGHGSSAPSVQYVNNGGKASDPSYSEDVTGWRFVGWYDEAACRDGHEWVFGANTVSGANAIIYAKWLPDPTVTFSVPTGVDAISSQRASVNLPTPSGFPTAISSYSDQWAFAGWTESSSVNSTSAPATLYPAGAPYSGSQTSAFTLYAVYSRNKYLVVYDNDMLVANTDYVISTWNGDNYAIVGIADVNNAEVADMDDNFHDKILNGLHYYTLDNPTENAVWHLTGSTDSWVLQNKATGKYLDLSSTSSPMIANASATLSITEGTGEDAQTYKLTKSSNHLAISSSGASVATGDATYYFLYKLLSSKYMTSPAEPTFTVTWKVSGEDDQTSTVAASTGISASDISALTIPGDDHLEVKNSGCITNTKGKFMGWSTTDLGSEDGQGAPSDLFKTYDKAPYLTGDITLYAVFAEATISGDPYYGLVEDDGDATEGTYLIVYNGTYAMGSHHDGNNADTYSDYSNISSYYNDEDKKIASNSTTNALAYIAEKTTNGYSLKHSETISSVATDVYLGCSKNDNKGLRWDYPFTASTDEWLLAAGSVNSVGQSSRYIRWNNTSGQERFATYLSSAVQDIQLYKYNPGVTYSDYRTSCCAKKVTIGTPSQTGSGTVTFASGGNSVAAGDKIPTCIGATTITATVTPTNGYKCTVLEFTRSDSEDLDPDPAISVPFTGAQNYDLTFEQNADGVTLNTSVTFVALVDHYIDNMHYNATQNKSGNYGTAPTLSDESKGTQCTGLHYRFIGWIPEDDMNMETGVPTTTANMVAGGATGKYATGTNYYAIWAEEE